MFVPETTSIEVYSSAEALVNSYRQGIEKLTEAYGLLEQAENLLGKAVAHPRTIGRGHYRSNVGEGDLDDLIQENQRGAWTYIIDKMQLRHLFSEKRFREVEEQIKNGQVPELTVENIFGLVQDMTANMNDFLQECIAETFDWLIPFRGSQYKTNKEHKIGPKVIKDYMVDSYGINYHQEQHLISLDNVFHLLDGKGPIKHPGTLVTTIKETMRDRRGENECETAYFKVRWFQKGTIHIWFKREDLLAELNRIGSGGKPHIGRKSD